MSRCLARASDARDIRPMGKALDRLPAGKRHELKFVVEVLTAALAEVVEGRRSLADGHILKIILFGSYARGDWVDDPVGRYFSDYDLLVVVDDERLTDIPDVWEGAEKRLLSALSSGRQLRTPVSLIVHSLADVNAQLARGRYFFVDIVRDGVTLFAVPGHPFVEPEELSPQTALQEAEHYFADWLTAADSFARGGKHAIDDADWKKAAFDLHQSTENLYNCLLLVMTLYTPKSHNLVRLRHLADSLDPRLAEVWPASTKFDKRCFELLRAAYVKARYSRHYKITEAELEWIVARVTVLRALVQDICETRIATLREKATKSAD